MELQEHHFFSDLDYADDVHHYHGTVNNFSGLLYDETDQGDGKDTA